MQQTVGQFSLKNQGGYVVKMGFQYLDPNNSSDWIRTKDETGKILLGQSKTTDPGEFGVPNGATVRIYADIEAGPDKHGGQNFIYQSGNASTANYSCSGTTLDSKLGLDSVS